MSKDLNNGGVVIAIVQAACKNAGIEIDCRFLPPARAFEMTKKGKYDALVGWVWSKEREKVFYYSDSIFEAPLVFFHHKKFNFDWKTMEDLKGVAIGTVLKKYYGPEFQAASDSGTLNIQAVAMEKFNFRKLLGNRIKLFPLNLYSGYYIINQDYPPAEAVQITHHPQPLKTSVYHVLFSKAVPKNKGIAEKFDRGLRQLKESGEYENILSRFQY